MPQASITSWLSKSNVTNNASDRFDEQRVNEADNAEGGVADRGDEIGDTAAVDNITSTHDGLPPKSLGHVTWRPQLRPIPLAASIESCSEENLRSFRRLMSLLLPIPYPESFYKSTVNDPVISSMTRVVLWKHPPSGQGAAKATSPEKGGNFDADRARLVAAIRCRLLADPANDKAGESKPIVYIAALATLSPFRSHGLASYLLQHIMRIGFNDYGATAIMAHVWEANEDGLAWYTKRGFQIIGTDDDYYRRLAPKTSAFIVRRDISVADVIDWEPQSSNDAQTAS